MHKAVTLIELLIVISVMLILTGLAIFNLRSIGGAANIDQAKTTVVAALREAQTNSRAVIDDQNWGVHFETNKIIIFASNGSGFNPDDSQNKLKLLGDNITCNVVLAQGGNDILFTKRTGVTDQPGVINLSDGSGTQQIVINSQGSINY